jgi:hypothetical protein
VTLNYGLNILLFLVNLCFDFIVYKEYDLLSIDTSDLLQEETLHLAADGDEEEELCEER